MYSEIKLSDLSERVTFEGQVEQKVSPGIYEKAWVDVAKSPQRWAQVKPVRGRENLEGGQVTPTTTYLITVRSDELTSALVPSDRAIWRGKALNITSVTNRDMRHRFMTIEAVEGQDT